MSAVAGVEGVATAPAAAEPAAEVFVIPVVSRALFEPLWHPVTTAVLMIAKAMRFMDPLNR